MNKKTKQKTNKYVFRTKMKTLIRHDLEIITLSTKNLVAATSRVI